MPPKKLIEKPTSASQVTSQWLRVKLVELQAPSPIPTKKAERWALYRKLIGKPKSPAKPKLETSEEKLMKMKAVDLRAMAAEKGKLSGITTKKGYVDVILGKTKVAPKKVGARKIILKKEPSAPPKFLKDCKALVDDQALMKHQERIIDHFQKHDGLVAFHLPGSGKTLSATAASLCWLKDHPDGMIFVAVPGPLVDNFIENGLKKFYGLSHNFIAKHFVVDTYVKLPKYVQKQQLDSKPFFLIVDEAHKLKAKIRKTTRGAKKGKQLGQAPKGIMELATKADKVMVMSGTVFRNAERDLENLVAIARKGLKEDLYKATGKYNRETKKYDFDPKKIKKYFKCVISYYPGDPTKGYPKEVYHNVDIKMPKTYWKNPKGTGYWDRHLALKGYLGKTEDSKQMYVSQMRAKANKTYTQGKTESPKGDWIVNLIKKDPTQKTIIYSFFKESGVEATQDKLKEAGIKSTYLKADLSAAAKNKIVKAYNSAKENTNGEGIILITKATSEGIDFKGTRRIIIMEKDYSSAGNRQIIARGARYLSHEDLPKDQQRVDIYFLKLVLPEGVARPPPDDKGNKFLTIDERVDEIVAIKDHREERFMDYIIGPNRQVTIETDPDCW